MTWRERGSFSARYLKAWSYILGLPDSVMDGTVARAKKNDEREKAARPPT
jgi:hypothetical protein